MSKSIAQLADEFVLYKHSLGYIYDTQECYLKRYCKFEDSYGYSSVLKKKAVVEYMDSLSESPGTLYGTVSVLREFGRYLYRHGYKDAYIIPDNTVARQTPAPPYFFTQSEIDEFFCAVDTVEPHPRFSGREYIVPAFFRVLYCCGIRCKEARMLRCANISLREGWFDVIQSKGPKTRRIYINDELADFLKNYNKKIEFFYPEREFFFPGYDSHKHLSEGFVTDNFHRFWKLAFPDFTGDIYPRAYDFRHHFAWANINRWAADGMDVNVMLPYLMRYMGHQTVKQTLYYFHFVPDFYTTFQHMELSLEDVIPEVPE